MFFYDGVKSNISCALKVDTKCKGWSETMTKILRQIKGLSYNLDTKEGMIYISGKVDSQKILRMIARHENKVELCWMNSVEKYSYVNNYGANNYPMDMSMSSYPQYQRGYYYPHGPPLPPQPMPYYQYTNYDPMYAPQQHGYPPQVCYYQY